MQGLPPELDPANQKRLTYSGRVGGRFFLVGTTSISGQKCRAKVSLLMFSVFLCLMEKQLKGLRLSPKTEHVEKKKSKSKFGRVKIVSVGDDQPDGSPGPLTMQIEENLAGNPGGQSPMPVPMDLPAKLSTETIPLTPQILPKPDSIEDQKTLTDWLKMGHDAGKKVIADWNIDAPVTRSFTSTTVGSAVDLYASNPAEITADMHGKHKKVTIFLRHMNARGEYDLTGVYDVPEGTTKIVQYPALVGEDAKVTVTDSEAVPPSNIVIAPLEQIYHDVNTYSNILQYHGAENIGVDKSVIIRGHKGEGEVPAEDMQASQDQDFDWGGLVSSIVTMGLSFI
jgi:hypothetical protein